MRTWAGRSEDVLVGLGDHAARGRRAEGDGGAEVAFLSLVDDVLPDASQVVPLFLKLLRDGRAIQVEMYLLELGGELADHRLDAGVRHLLVVREVEAQVLELSREVRHEG